MSEFNNMLDMDAFFQSNDQDDLGDLEKFITPDEDENPEDVVGEDDDVTSSQEDDLDDTQAGDGDDNDEGDDGEKDSSSNLYSSLAKVLHEEGVTPHLDLNGNPIKSAEDLVKAIQNEIKANEYADLTESQKSYLEALRNGVPEEAIKENFQIQNTLDQITEDVLEENEDLRVDIIKQYYIARGFDEAESAKYAKRSVDLGEDLEDAKDSLGTLKQLSEAKRLRDIEDAKTAKLAAEEGQKRALQELKSTVEKIEDLIPSATLDPKGKDSLLKIITSPAGEANGQQVNQVFKYINDNPIEANIKLAYIYQATDGFKNLDKLVTKKAANKASQELERILRSDKNNPLFTGGGDNSGLSNSGLEDNDFDLL